MYAIAEILGKQVKVAKDQIIEVPKMKGQVGDSIECDKVLFFDDDGQVTVGKPYISSARVTAEIFAHDRTKKTLASIYKRRKQYKKSWGFRRDFTLLKVTDLTV